MSSNPDPEVRKAHAHKYHLEHREEILARQRARRATSEGKTIDAAARKAWIARDPARWREILYQAYLKRQQQFFAYKSTLACSHCGLTGGQLICFHHLDPTAKEHNIGGLAQSKFDKPVFWAEIAKCIPLCHNCHATLHYKLDHPEVDVK